jgi:hypothetical protein
MKMWREVKVAKHILAISRHPERCKKKKIAILLPRKGRVVV